MSKCAFWVIVFSVKTFSHWRIMFASSPSLVGLLTFYDVIVFRKGDPMKSVLFQCEGSNLDLFANQYLFQKSLLSPTLTPIVKKLTA